MKEKYPEAWNRRVREFEQSRLTFNFTEEDLERDEKAQQDISTKRQWREIEPGSGHQHGHGKCLDGNGRN